MSTLSLAWRYLWARPMAALLNVLLLALGLGSMTFLLLVGAQLSRAFDRDLAGIDVVVGAKGSPMQLILSGVLHVDVPTGNVPLQAVQELARHPLVAQVIPISLGDNLQSFRIVGTSLDYPRHYQAQLVAGGSWWTQPMQAVLGAQVAQRLGLKVGDRFIGSHGLGSGGHTHGDNPYTVVGLMQPTGSVLDRLILTDLASVWKVHEDYTAADEEDRAALEAEREVTLALVRYRSPMAALSFPRYVNTSTEMQAAAPAVEVTRLLHLLGLGTQVLQAFAAVLLGAAALSVFLALWNAVRERRYDLALLRMLGAPASRVAALLLSEALWLGVLAAAAGLLLGQGFAAVLGWFLQLDTTLLVAGWVWPVELVWVVVVSLAVSLLASLLPALGAYRVSVLALLQSR